MKRVTVSIPEEIDARVRQWAEEEDKSLSQVYADAVEAHLREKRRQKAAQRVASILERTTVQPGAVEELHREREGSDRSFPQSR
jgi:metal-responsive CopG/Arc/MetJ family transcriptional regulator